MSNPKTLDVVDINDGKAKVSDIKVVGNGDTFQLLCKASSKDQGWMKSTKAMEIPGVGVVLQVSTQQNDNVAEALTYIPGVKIVSDVNGGKKLAVMYTTEELIAMQKEAMSVYGFGSQ